MSGHLAVKLVRPNAAAGIVVTHVLVRGVWQVVPRLCLVLQGWEPSGPCRQGLSLGFFDDWESGRGYRPIVMG